MHTPQPRNCEHLARAERQRGKAAERRDRRDRRSQATLTPTRATLTLTSMLETSVAAQM